MRLTGIQACLLHRCLPAGTQKGNVPSVQVENFMDLTWEWALLCCGRLSVCGGMRCVLAGFGVLVVVGLENGVV